MLAKVGFRARVRDRACRTSSASRQLLHRHRKRLLLGFTHPQDAYAVGIRVSEQATLEEGDLASRMRGKQVRNTSAPVSVRSTYTTSRAWPMDSVVVSLIAMSLPV